MTSFSQWPSYFGVELLSFKKLRDWLPIGQWFWAFNCFYTFVYLVIKSWEKQLAPSVLITWMQSEYTDRKPRSAPPLHPTTFLTFPATVFGIAVKIEFPSWTPSRRWSRLIWKRRQNVIFLSLFFKNGPNPASFCSFWFFSHSNSSDKYTFWTL